MSTSEKYPHGEGWYGDDEKHTMSDLNGWYQEGRPFPLDTHAEPYNEDIEMDEIGHEVRVERRPFTPQEEALIKHHEVRVVNPDTGGMKNRKDCELFTAPPIGLVEYGKVCSYGSRDKYAQNNWRYGFVWSLSANALLRHYLAWVGGEDHDPESGLHHMAHAAWHALVLVQFGHDHPELDDRFGMPAHPKQGQLF